MRLFVGWVWPYEDNWRVCNPFTVSLSNEKHRLQKKKKETKCIRPIIQHEAEDNFLTVDEVTNKKTEVFRETEGSRHSPDIRILSSPFSYFWWNNITSANRSFFPLIIVYRVHSFWLHTIVTIEKRERKKRRQTERERELILRVHRIVTTINIHFEF